MWFMLVGGSLQLVIMITSQHGKFGLAGVADCGSGFAGLALQSNIMVKVANQSLCLTQKRGGVGCSAKILCRFWASEFNR